MIYSLRFWFLCVTQVMVSTHSVFRRAMILAAMLVAANSVSADDYQIGVYYFPGWKEKQVGAPSAAPWEPIKAFPEREPALGWYDDGSDEVMAQQLDWMHGAGIDFVVFDWYYVQGRRVLLEHALAAYMRSPNRAKVKFSILWANHSGMPKSQQDWESMVQYWVRYYFPRPEYMRTNGRPAVFIFSADTLRKQAESFGTTPKILIAAAQVIAKEAGLPGIDFIAGTGAYLSMIDSAAKDAGYAAFSAYNYNQGPLAPLDKPSHSYKELDQGYQAHWRRFAEKGSLPLVVPMTSGWDRRPWGGSRDPLHDNSLSTPQEFSLHLQAAKTFMDANSSLTRRMGVICCWNEFGEGSFIEPTKKMGSAYLDQVKRVFGGPK